MSPAPPRILAAAVRGFALFAGLFLAANALLGLLDPARDLSVWLLDLRALDGSARAPLLGVTGGLLAVWAVRRAAPAWMSLVVTVAAGGLAAAAGLNAAAVLRLRAVGTIETAAVPLSVGTAAVFAAVAFVATRRTAAQTSLRPVLAGAALCAAAFPVAQILSFGGTDYRRDADAIVVFGAKAYADGRASLTLADRVRTACALWRDGRAPVLFLSGGPGEGDVHETEAMRRVALAEGVPDQAIVLDRSGVSTRATVDDAALWLRRGGLSRVLAVSHGYHLPRVKLLFERAGIAAFTVPARESRAVAKTPWFVAREVAAWWVAWAAPAAARCV